MEAWTGIPSGPDAFPMTIPSRTGSPGLTMQDAGMPAYCRIDMTARGGTAAFVMGCIRDSSEVRGGHTPPLKVRICVIGCAFSVPG
jgi:hypothetical protein